MKKIIFLIMGLGLSMYAATEKKIVTVPMPLVTSTNLVPHVTVDANGNPVYIKSKCLENVPQACSEPVSPIACGCCQSCCAYGWSFMIKQGYFYPQEKFLRDIFRSAGSQGGYYIEGDIRYNFCTGFNLEVNGSYFSHKGCSLVCAYDFMCSGTILDCQTPQKCECPCGDPVCFKAPALGVGVNYVYDYCDWIGLLIGSGVKIFFVTIDTKYPYVLQHESRYAPGVYLQTGLMFNPCRGFLVELFADYMYGGISSKSTCCSSCYKINVGGFATGIGLGYEF